MIGCFGNHALDKQLWISSTKSMMGHLLGAAGAVEAIACVKAIETGWVQPTINLEDQDPECPLDFVANHARASVAFVARSRTGSVRGHRRQRGSRSLRRLKHWDEARTMQCPSCRTMESRVLDSRLVSGGTVTWRRRECDACKRRFTTYERVELSLPVVV